MYWHKVVYTVSFFFFLIPVKYVVVPFISSLLLVIFVSFFFFLINLARHLSILLIFVNNQLLGSLISSFDFLFYISLASTLICIIYFLLLSSNVDIQDYKFPSNCGIGCIPQIFACCISRCFKILCFYF